MNEITVLLLNDFQRTTLRYALYQAIAEDNNDDSKHYYSDDERAVMVSIYDYLAQDSEIPF